MVWRNHRSATHDGECSANNQRWQLDPHLGWMRARRARCTHAVTLAGAHRLEPGLLHLAALIAALSDGLRRQNREQSQGQRRALLAAEVGDHDRRPPRWTGTPAVTPGEQVRRLVGALMSRCRPGTRQRAARTRPQVRAGQRGPRLGSTARWADGAASRRGRCAPCPATGRVIRAQAFPNAPRVCRPIAKRFVTPHAAQRRPCGVTQAQRRRRTQRGAFMY